MNVALPVQPILELFEQNHTEALSLDYDHDADVLYVNFQRPEGPGRNPEGLLLGHASGVDHSEMDDSDTILRYQGDRMVGFTILNASQRT